MCVLLDETLLWKMVQFYQDIEREDIRRSAALNRSQSLNSTISYEEAVPIRQCWFGTLDLVIGNISLTG